MQEFDTEAKSVVVEGTDWTFDHDRELLVQDIRRDDESITKRGSNKDH